jgi:hypothetical protein
VSVSHPRRQQFRRLAQAVSRAATSALTGFAALAAALEGHLTIAVALLLLAAGLAVASRHAFGLAARNRVGADSEAQVRHVLAELAQ